MTIEPLILPDNYPEVLADIAREVHTSLIATPGLNIAYQRAAEIALSVAERVRANNGGVSTYIPRGVSYLASIRDTEMYAKFNGVNYVELAREYNLTEMRVRQIVDAMAAAERKTRQQPLFSDA